MSRLIINITLIAIINVLSLSPSYGQDKKGILNKKFGFGVMIDGDSKVYFPISITPNLRVEPEISFFQRNDDDGEFKMDYKSLSIGIGILPMTHIGNITTYYGFRFGYLIFSNRFEYSNSLSDNVTINKTSQTGFYIAPIIGAEYSFANRLSIGPEVSIDYSTTNGKRTSNDDSSDSSSKSINVNAGVLLRFYFK